MLLLGIDIGTGGCKATLVDPEEGLVSSAFREYQTHHPEPSWAEQSPEDWYEALKSSVRELLSKVGRRDVGAVCIDGQTHAAVLMDRQGRVLRPSIVWTDQRSTKQVELIKRILGEERMIEITYNPVICAFTLPQILWVKENEPEVLKRAFKLQMAKDFIRFKLTGSLDWLTDTTDAMGTLMFDVRKFKWSEEICGQLEVELEKLPEVVNSDCVVGQLSKGASEELGIPEGTPIVAGCHDVSAEPLAAGTIDEGQCFIKLATAGVISVTTKEPKPDLKGRTVTYCLPTTRDGVYGWFTKSATLSCGSSYRWFRDSFCEREVKLAERLKRSPYELMDELASKAPPGSLGLLFHPYLGGEGSPYWDPYLRGSFFGISLSHGREHFCLAVLEGVAFSIKDSLSIFDDLRLPIKEVMIIGGGSKSRLWRQIISDVFGMRLLRPISGDASFGSALIAGVGIGIFKSLREAVDSCVKTESSVEPDPKRHELYEEFFRVYKEVHDRLVDLYERMCELSSKSMRA